MRYRIWQIVVGLRQVDRNYSSFLLYVCHPNPIERNSSYSSSVRNVFYPPPSTCNKTRLECPKGVKDEIKQAKRVAERHQLEIGAQRAPRFLVSDICHIGGMIILMTRLNFCFKQLYICIFPDQSTVKHNPDQGQDIWNMQNNSEKCDRSWRQGRHSSQNNLGGLSLSLSLCLDHWPACLRCSKSGHYWWCLPAWSFISMSNISCPANCN